MSFVIHRGQGIQIQMRILLRRRQTRVPQQFLYHAQVCAAIEKVRGETMAQAVRPHLDRNSRLLQMLVDDARHAPGRDPLAAIIEKDRRLALAGKLPAPALLLAVIAQRLHGDLTDRNDPLFGALADHPNNAELKIDVGPIEADQLTDTRSEEHTSELQSPCNLVCRLLL